MAPNNVYGKRLHRHVQSDLFLSPKKSSPHFDVLEVADELANLTVTDTTADCGGRDNRPRTALVPTSANKVHESGIRQNVRNQATNALFKKTFTETADGLPVKQTKSSHDRQTCPEKVAPSHVQVCSAQDAGNLPSRIHSLDPIEERLQALTLQRPQSPPDIYHQHVSELLQHSFRPLTSFSEWSDQLSSHFTVAKIAEASFGEVYRLSLQKQHATLKQADESVLKIIALKPPPSTLKGSRMSKATKKRLAMMSDPSDVASEVRLLQRMTCTPGFTNFRDVCILKGRPGSAFVDAWKGWNTDRKSKNKDTSVFSDPGKKASYAEDQLWAVIEMQDAGTDLENVPVTSIWAVWDVFWGVVLSLGKGEEGARFEHRDLHLGNICISSASGAQGFNNPDLAGVDSSRRLGFTDITTTIIDYTISRAEMQSSEDEKAQKDDAAYFDLEKDPAIFEGDSDQEYQYDIYRHMRAIMYLDDPLADLDGRWDEAQASGRTWRGFHPQTNLVWLHFVLHKLLEQIVWPSSHHVGGASDEGLRRWNRSCELEAALQKVQNLLDPQELPASGVRSAGDLVALALTEQWLGVEDVIGKRPAVGKKRSKARKRAPRV